MRLIDADVAQSIADKELFVDEAGTVQFVLSHTPTIDAVPVVRCKDCKHWDEIKHGTGWCQGFAPSDVFSDYDYYCSNGERKEDGNEDR